MQILYLLFLTLLISPYIFCMEKIWHHGAPAAATRATSSDHERAAMIKGLEKVSLDTPLTRKNCVNDYWAEVETLSQEEKNKRCKQIERVCNPDKEYRLLRCLFAAAALIGANTNEYISQTRQHVNRALYWATKNNDTAFVQLLLSKGASPLACSAPTCSSIIFAIKSVAVAQLFYEKEPSILNERTRTFGLTILGNACTIEEYPLDLAAWFIARGLNVDGADCNGNTPLHRLCRRDVYQPKHYAHAVGFFKLLMSARANCDLKNTQGKTPLQLEPYPNLSKWNSKFNALVSRLIPIICGFHKLTRDRSSFLGVIPRDINTLVEGLLLLELDKEIEDHKNLPDEKSDDTDSDASIDSDSSEWSASTCSTESIDLSQSSSVESLNSDKSDVDDGYLPLWI